MKNNYFPKKKQINPVIYAYEDTHPDFKDLLKIGYTNKNAETRVREQHPIVRPTKTWKIVLEQSAMKSDGVIITDHEVRNYLVKKGFKKSKGEWVKCNVNDVLSAIIALKNGEDFISDRIYDFKLRPEQIEAINKTIKYFHDLKRDNKKKEPHFLWNAKMRFGKTFAAYHLAKKMKWKKILILTFKPAV